MDNAIAACTWQVGGGYTCNIISLQESKRDCNKLTKTRKKYTGIFEFNTHTVCRKLINSGNHDFSYDYVKNVRLNCLELFKIVMLESKGYVDL